MKLGWAVNTSHKTIFLKNGCDSLKRNVEQWLEFVQKACRKRSGDVLCHKLNMSQQCKSTFHRNQNSLLREAAVTSRWLCCLQVTWSHPAASCCSWDPWELSVSGVGHWTSREKVEWLSGLGLRLVTLRKAARRCDNRLQGRNLFSLFLVQKT